MKNILLRTYGGRDAGLLALRIGIGLMFIITHGMPKLMGGPERWVKVGKAMENFGIDWGHMYWGLAAGITETLGALLLLAGIFFIPANIFLIGTMIVAAGTHFAKGQGLSGASHAVEAAIMFASLIFIGPGRLSLDYLIFNRKKVLEYGTYD